MSWSTLLESLDRVSNKISTMNTDATSLSGKIDGVSQQFATLISEYDALIGKSTKAELSRIQQTEQPIRSAKDMSLDNLPSGHYDSTGREVSVGEWKKHNAAVRQKSGHYDSTGRELSVDEWNKYNAAVRKNPDRSEFALKQQSERQYAELINQIGARKNEAIMKSTQPVIETKVSYRFSDAEIREISDRLDDLEKRKT